MRNTIRLAAICTVLLFSSPQADTCNNPPCESSGDLICFMSDVTLCSIQPGDPAPCLPFWIMNASNQCTPCDVRIDSISIEDQSPINFILDIPSVTSPNPGDVLPRRSSNVGEFKVDFPNGVVSGLFIYKISITSTNLCTQMSTTTCCTIKVQITPDTKAMAKEGNCGYNPGVTGEQIFEITNASQSPATFDWKIRSVQTTSSAPPLRHDDGGSDNAAGLTNGGETAWLQRFDASGGSDLLTEILVAWGSAAFPGNSPPNGAPATVYLWDDSDNDGDPTTGLVLLLEQPTTVQNVDTDILNAVSIPATQVNGVFFVGTSLDRLSGHLPAPIDQDASSAGRAWIGGSAQPGGFDPHNVTGGIGLFELDTIGVPGVFLLGVSEGPHIDHFPIAQRGDPVPPGDPSSTTIPMISGTINLAAGATAEVGADIRSYEACHSCSNNRVELELTNQSTGEVTRATANFTALRDGWTGVPIKKGLCGDLEFYCTAKTGLTCGPPAILAGGNPQATATSGFLVLGVPARGNRSGLLLYTNSGPAAFPFQGGFLCVNPAPLLRTTGVTSGGTNGACDGVFSIDMNTFAQGLLGGNPAAFLLLPGTQVNAQWWGRDSVPTGSYLTNGMSYVICL